jgi:hypothetical protein
LLGVFNVKLGEDIFKLTNEIDSLHQDSNDNGVRIVSFDTSQNVVSNSMTFPHPNIQQYTLTSLDGKTHNHTDHIWTDRRWHQSLLNVQPFRGADCNTDHYMVVARVRERPAVSKQETQKFDVETLNVRKLRELEVRKLYQMISNRFAALENLNESEDINRAWENKKENI